MPGREELATLRPATGPCLDPCTQSNYYDFKVESTELDIAVSFEKQTISGAVTYKLKYAKEPVTKLILDTSYLDIQKASVNGHSVKYDLLERSGPYGSPLEIPVSGDELVVKIEYSTTDKCTAIQFIEGDTGPYLFSQCQSIHARSLFPCFDTPAIKSSYKFSIESPLPVLMSGLPTETSESGLYTFNQPIPIPSYLVAIASGNIVSAPIGPRSDVYSEQPNIKECQWEFEADMEDFIQVAEELAFKYEWTKFDVLVLPSSFPYGGMENPNITFATPTLICKDRSQVRVLAHELAHSWAGNLVTNCSWEHFWLNEGWCVYFERRILGAVAALSAKRQGIQEYKAYGEKHRQFAAILGWSSLEESFPSVKEEATSLVWDLSQNGDPDDFYSRFPYEKGFNFLYFLEKKLGGFEDFDGFIPYYFKKFRYLSIDSYQFIDALYEYFEPKGKKDILDSIDFKQWLFEAGLPPYADFDTSLVDECTSLADQWVGIIKSKATKLPEKDVSGFDSNQHLLFLEDLSKKLEGVEGASSVVQQLPEIYPSYINSSNFEIIFDFYSLLIKHGKYAQDSKIATTFADWLGTVGRMKYVRPGYRLLKQYFSQEFAVSTFERFKAKYHPICRNMVKKDLGI